jgi:hypothetical protein
MKVVENGKANPAGGTEEADHLVGAYHVLGQSFRRVTRWYRVQEADHKVGERYAFSEFDRRAAVGLKLGDGDQQ